MATYPYTLLSSGQKLGRQATTTATEDTYTFTGHPSVSLVVYAKSSSDWLIHSSLGLTATDGLLVSAGTYFPIVVAAGQAISVGIRASTLAGTIDCYVLGSPGLNGLPEFAPVALGDFASNALVRGNSRKPTYTISDLAGAPTGANSVLATWESSALKVSRLRRLFITNPGFGTAAAGLQLELVRTTAASTGGVLQVPAQHDPRDAAFGGLARITAPAITAGARVWAGVIYQPATLVGAFAPLVIEFYGQISQSITVANGVANGLALRCVNGSAGASGFAYALEIAEESA